ncbi:MAG TPA: response regulator transcription factor [Acidimicrobiales bacterium]|jgi:DNA-binding NarL/FixJ family response regulator|nr:response regulator transcription factor [Acidimicrobiales bacterium]
MSEGRRHGRDLRVLIADDEPDVRLLLRLGLRHHQIEVIGEAANGLEVIEFCSTDEPDAIVLDLLMPGMNGFEAIPQLKRDHPHVGIVAYTAVAGDFVRREMARLDIPLLLKSGDSTPLADALHAAAEQARASSA